MSARRGGRRANPGRPRRSAAQPQSILAQMLVRADEPRPKADRKRRPSDPDWEDLEETPLVSRINSRRLPPTRSAEQKRQKREEQTQKRKGKKADQLKLAAAANKPASSEQPDPESSPEPQPPRKRRAALLCPYVKVPTDRKKRGINVNRTQRRSRDHYVDEAVAERLRREAEAEAEAANWDLPPAKRPRQAARPHALRRIVGMLAEGEDEPPAPTEGASELGTGADPATELGLELVPVPGQELEPELDPEMDQEMNPDMEWEPEQELESEEPDQDLGEPEPESDTELNPEEELHQINQPEETTHCPTQQRQEGSGDELPPVDTSEIDQPPAEPEPESTDPGIAETKVPATTTETTASARTVKGAAREKTAAEGARDPVRTMTVARDAGPTGSAKTVTIAEPKVNVPKSEAETVETKVDEKAFLRLEATDAEGVLAKSMIMQSTRERGMRCIPHMKTLQCQARDVYQACAEYSELLSSSGRAPVPTSDREPDCVPPPGSCGQRLTVLRHRQTLGIPAHPRDLAALLRDQRGSLRQTMLLPTTMRQALDVIHELRLQNLRLQKQLLRAGSDPLREASDEGLTEEVGKGIPLRRAAGRGSHKELSMVHTTRLKHLELLEAGVERAFTPAQIRALRGNLRRSQTENQKRPQAHWPEEDLRRAVELRAMTSRKVFEFIRGPLGLPMPSINTLEYSCKRFPELKKALDIALGEPAPRCPTCRRNRDDATTEEQWERFNAPPRPRKKKNTELAAAKKAAKQAVALGRRTDPATVKSEHQDTPSRKRPLGSRTDKYAPDRRPPPDQSFQSWSNNGVEKEETVKTEASESESDDAAGGSDDAAGVKAEPSESESDYEDYGEEQEEDGEEEDSGDLIATLADPAVRRQIVQQGMWL